MPDGRVHTSVSVLSAIYVGGVSAYAYFTFDGVAPMVLSSSFGALCGVLLSPDLDVDNGNISHFLFRQRLGPIFGLIWKVYWWPYAKLVPHRSWISHLPFISTAIRIAYLFWWLPFVWPDWWSLMWIFWFAFGLAISDINHWFLDMTVGSW